MNQRKLAIFSGICAAQITTVLFIIFSPLQSFAADLSEEQLKENILPKATAAFHLKTLSSDYLSNCTATIFEKDDKVYRLITAAHCVAKDDEVHKQVKVASAKWFINFDDEGTKLFAPAKVVAAGYQHRGDDFAVIEVEIKALKGYTPPLVPLANQPPKLWEPVINIAFTYGLGKQGYGGHISLPKLDTPIEDDNKDINWQEVMLLQLEVGGGSSGSAVVSLKQKGIIGVIVGIVKGKAIAIPIERFKKFWAMSKEGKYKWFKPEESDNGPDEK